MFQRFKKGRDKAEARWAEAATDRLTLDAAEGPLRITPLADARSERKDLFLEDGVSYFIEAGVRTLLLDVGYNRKKLFPPPYARNAGLLGIDLERVEELFISHCHLDHVGGMKAQRKRALVLGGLLPNLRRVLLPIPMSTDGPAGEVVGGPLALFPGAASTGPLPRMLFFLGYTLEQSLLVGRPEGQVLVSGCGHPGIVRMVRHAKALTGRNVTAVVGGLHLVAREGPFKIQKYVGTGRFPWDPPTADEVRRVARDLKAEGVEILAPSPHDMCDLSMSIFREEFGAGYRPVLVGTPIEL